MELQNRARWYARVIAHLYAARGLRGELRLVSRGARHLSLGVRLADPLRLDLALNIAESLALQTNTPAVIAQRLVDRPGLVSYQFQLQDGYWQTYTRADLARRPGLIGVGLGESKRQINFAFDPPHALIAGTTGSGKSEAIKSLLVGLFTAYAPDELRAVIVDPDGDHADHFRNVAHLGGLPVAIRPEDIELALRHAHAEFRRRKQENRRDAPPLVVVIDEAEDALAGRMELVAPLARHGRKYNVNLVLATQKPSEDTLPGILDKINNRWVGLVQNANISAHLTGQAGLGCNKLTGRGDFVHVAGHVNERLLVAMAMRQDYDALPRTELAPPEDPGLDVDDYEDEPGPGRPSNAPDPRAVARYLWYGPGKVTRPQARGWGLSWRAHYLNRDFAQEVKEELLALRSMMGGKA